MNSKPKNCHLLRDSLAKISVYSQITSNTPNFLRYIYLYSKSVVKHFQEIIVKKEKQNLRRQEANSPSKSYIFQPLTFSFICYVPSSSSQNSKRASTSSLQTSKRWVCRLTLFIWGAWQDTIFNSNIVVDRCLFGLSRCCHICWCWMVCIFPQIFTGCICYLCKICVCCLLAITMAN